MVGTQLGLFQAVLFCGDLAREDVPLNGLPLKEFLEHLNVPALLLLPLTRRLLLFESVRRLRHVERFGEALVAHEDLLHAPHAPQLSALAIAATALAAPARCALPPSRYYNTTERMTTLFRKITNKMIANCRNYVMEGADRSAALWEQPMMGVVARLQACLALNEGYQEQYFMTRDKLLTQPKGKQFDFNESAIFGKFDLFVRRVEKLIEMFSTVEQFSVLATHNVEGMEGLMNSFRQIVDEFTRKPSELLDYQKGQFDRDYLEFNANIHELESSLQGFINSSFENITSTAPLSPRSRLWSFSPVATE